MSWGGGWHRTTDTPGSCWGPPVWKKMEEEEEEEERLLVGEA